MHSQVSADDMACLSSVSLHDGENQTQLSASVDDFPLVVLEVARAFGEYAVQLHELKVFESSPFSRSGAGGFAAVGGGEGGRGSSWDTIGPVQSVIASSVGASTAGVVSSASVGTAVVGMGGSSASIIPGVVVVAPVGFATIVVVHVVVVLIGRGRGSVGVPGRPVKRVDARSSSCGLHRHVA